MKKYSILIALLLMSLKLYAQNTEPGQFEFTYGTHTSPQVINPNEFPLTKMLFGFQWGASFKMNEALAFHTHHSKLCVYYDECRKVLCSF